MRSEPRVVCGERETARQVGRKCEFQRVGGRSGNWSRLGGEPGQYGCISRLSVVGAAGRAGYRMRQPAINGLDRKLVLGAQGQITLISIGS